MTAPRQRLAARRKVSQAALLLGGLVILASLLIGYYAYRENLREVEKDLCVSNLSLARLLARFAASSPLDPLEAAAWMRELGAFWEKREPLYEGEERYLCLVDHRGRVVFHTGSSAAVGSFVGDVLLPREGTPSLSVLALLEERGEYAGYRVSWMGQDQLAAFAYSPALDMLVCVYLPRPGIEAALLKNSRSWIIGLCAICFLLLPLVICLLYWSFLAAQRQAAQTNRELETEVAERRRAEERLRHFSRNIIGVQEEERRRVARELHDGVNQLLVAAKLYLEPVAEQAAQAGEKVQGLLDRAIREIRGISHDLRPSILDDLGLRVAVSNLCEECTHGACAVSCRFDAFPEELPGAVETAFYRILQEALKNALLHAGASQVQVRFAGEEGAVVMEVADNGRGLPPEAERPRGTGLRNMQQRAELLQGTFALDSSAAGTQITVRLPLKGEMADEQDPRLPGG